MLNALEAMAMNALLFERADDPFDLAVLLQVMRNDKLLLQAIAAHQGREVPARKDQPVVRPQKEILIEFASVPNLAVKACSSAALVGL